MIEPLILKRVRLGEKHSPTGFTRHFLGDRPIPPVSSLAIAKYEKDVGFYLFYYGANGEELTDTYHDSLDEAVQQAQLEFGVTPDDWESVR